MDDTTLKIHASRTLDAPVIVCRKLQPGESRIYREMRLLSLQRYPESFGYTRWYFMWDGPPTPSELYALGR